MPEHPSKEDRTTEPRTEDSAVDEALKRRLREAYLNDEEDALVVTAVRVVGDEVVVEMHPPHGETTHVERFDAPKHGSLAECAEFVAFLDAAGVSPLDLDDLVGTRVPATFDPETGWRVARASRNGPADEFGPASPVASIASAWRASLDWAREYRDWLIALLLVGGELLFITLIVVRFA
jgi:hypothetical protein